MLETSARLLRLLSLLQSRREWTGPELAQRLEVSERTVRNDIDRLRSLGYPVDANRGAVGGYRLGAGAQLPPLLLDDDEAVATVLGLRAATGLAGVEEVSLRALAKLEQVLPRRLRRRVAALGEFALRVPDDTPSPQVDAEVLTTLAAACRDGERLRFDYRTHRGGEARRDVEPYRLIAWGRRWYLLAWDVERGDWRTFRADRVTPRVPTGPRFVHRLCLRSCLRRGVAVPGARGGARSRGGDRGTHHGRGRPRRGARRRDLRPPHRFGQPGEPGRAPRHARRGLRGGGPAGARGTHRAPRQALRPSCALTRLRARVGQTPAARVSAATRPA